MVVRSHCAFPLILLLAAIPCSAVDLDWVKVADDGKGFVQTESNQRFVPWGFNYDHDSNGKLIEDYWNDQWPAVESAFREMKGLGANVVRIHLQFGKFMESPTEPDQHSLDQLSRLVRLAEQTGLYLDLTVEFARMGSKQARLPIVRSNESVQPG